MAKTIIIDEFHVTVLASQGLPEREYAAIKRTLDGKRFQADLARSVRAVFREHAPLAAATARISR